MARLHADNRQAILALEPVQPQAVRNEQSVSYLPFFSLSKTPIRVPISYTQGRNSLTVTPGEHGLPTIYDKAIVIVAISHLNRVCDSGAPPSRDIVLRASDIIRTIRASSRDRKISKSEYDGLKKALDRLSNAKIRTNIVAGGVKEEGEFSLVTEWKIVSTEKADGWEMEAIRITLCRWLYDAVTKERRVIKLHPRYFELSALERRLYEVARREAYPGDRSREIPLTALASLVGSSDSNIRSFKQQLKDIVERQPLPDYLFHMVGDPNTPQAQLLAGAGLVPAAVRNGAPVNHAVRAVFSVRTEAAAEDRTDGMVTIPNL